MVQKTITLTRSIKNLIPLKWRHEIRGGLNYLTYKRRTVSMFRRAGDRKKIVIFMCPEHGNLGDHAIAHAENTFFRTYFPDDLVMEVSYKHYLYDRPGIIKNIRREDILATHGGGYFGMIYFHDEEMIRDIITTFPQNKIVVMPQTIFFDDSERSKKELNISKSIMRSHPHLIFCAREKGSYNFVVSNNLLVSNSNCHLIPDMFLYRDEDLRNSARKGILLCFRRDHESIIDTFQKREIEVMASRTGEKVSWTDTVIDNPISIKERCTALDSKLNEFRSAKLVITDRLHGMFFAAVTGTPCIAFDNISGKIKGCYQWIKNLGYIQMIDNPSEIIDHIPRLLSLENCVYDNSSLINYYDELANLIAGFDKRT